MNTLPVDLQVEYKYFKMRKLGRSDGRVVLTGSSLCLQDVPGRPRRGIFGARSKVDKSMGETSGGTAAALSVTIKMYDCMFVWRDIGIGRLALSLKPVQNCKPRLICSISNLLTIDRSPIVRSTQ